jgi:predicted metal-dependent phosphoesterase TrpH
MIIDLHIHSKDGSDGNYPIEQIFAEAQARNIELMSIADHDSIAAQARAIELAKEFNIKYLVGIELNVTFSHPEYRDGKEIYLDFLGYQFDYTSKPLNDKLQMLREYREDRARQILDKINVEFETEGREPFTQDDMTAIKATVDGAFGRPHIADYMVKKGIVGDRQEAFDKYLVKCYVPKFPLKLPEASKLIKDAGGVLVLAHGNDPDGTSLVKYTKSVYEQLTIVEENFLDYIDGLECWHSRHSRESSIKYYDFAKNHGLLMTGGSDCHQKPLRMGTVEVPDFVAEQFKV